MKTHENPLIYKKKTNKAPRKFKNLKKNLPKPKKIPTQFKRTRYANSQLKSHFNHMMILKTKKLETHGRSHP